MDINLKEIAKMIDVSLLKTTNTEMEIKSLINAAKKHRFICTFAMPCYSAILVEAFKDDDIMVGAPIGFPTGAELMEIKVIQAEKLYAVGCDEFDMVMNVGFLKSKQFKKVERDISEVRKAINGKTLKVIVEAMYLTDEELVDACKIVMSSGADFIKTGTGWAPKPTELRHIEIMSRIIGGRIKIKAAGGIRDYNTICKMHQMGVSRFGISLNSALAIMDEVSARQCE